MRIVSLLPSTTEILFAIGAGEDVVGVTFECNWPIEAQRRRIVSTSAMTPGLSPAQIDAEVRSRISAGEDLYHLDEGALSDLQPELVVTQDLCAVCAVDVTTVGAAMAHLGCDGSVLTIDPNTLDQVIESINTIGEATGRQAAAASLTADLRHRLAVTAANVAGRRRPRVAVLEWTDPPFNAGHWVPDMVIAAGGESVLGKAGQRSERIDWQTVADSKPEIVIVSPCGYRLEGARLLAEDLVRREVLPPSAAVWAVDADAAFVRPGPRLVDGVETLAGIFHHGDRQRDVSLSVQVSHSASAHGALGT